MTTMDITAPAALPEAEHRAQLRRALIASTVGTTIEWYDFLLYSTVTGLVFGKLFFPKSDPLVGVLEAFAIYTVGFIARPIGAAIFGHFGDRIGRKATLIATLLLTGLATAAVEQLLISAAIGNCASPLPLWLGTGIIDIERNPRYLGIRIVWEDPAMTSVDVPISGLSQEQHRAHLRRAMIASTVGTTIEWYDFLLYGQVTALVFGKLFFPKSDPLVGVLEAFAVFFIGFVGRPIGAAIFGHWGDRIGRKATLIATLLITGLATVAVGLVPTYASIGIWGAVLLTVIRLIQGIGVGGEWGGSVLLAMEWAQTNRNRGFIASWPQFGAPAGFFLANLAVLIFSWLSGDQFLTWGWRIPFLISIIMVAIGLWIRLGILETPVFQKVIDEERVERVPVLQVLKRQPKEVALTALLRLPEQAPGYIFGAFVFTYGTTVLGASRDFLLMPCWCRPSWVFSG